MAALGVVAAEEVNIAGVTIRAVAIVVVIVSG